MAARKVDFHVEQGEILGSIRPNGSGKTTVLSLISGECRPDQRRSRERIAGLPPFQISGRALMSNPDVLLLDAPSLGLSPRLSTEVFRSLAPIAATGVGMMLVEQNVRKGLAISQMASLKTAGCLARVGPRICAITRESRRAISAGSRTGLLARAARRVALR